MNKIWDIEDIQKIIKEYDKKMNLKCSELPIYISKKLTSSMGVLKYSIQNGIYIPKELRFSRYLCDGRYKEIDVINVIGHEYAHYMNMIEYNYAGHGSLHKAACVKIGVPTSRTFNAVSDNSKGNTKAVCWKIICTDCKSEIIYRRKTKTVKYIEEKSNRNNKFRCPKCLGHKLICYKDWC